MLGCSSGNQVPGTPDIPRERTSDTLTSHEILGLWQGTINPDTKTIEVTQLRGAEFHINALPFLEPPPFVYLTIESFKWNGNIIDANIGLTHPFLGLDQFSGFDVCGVFITNGSKSGFSDPDLVMAGTGDTRLTNADGITRWWNPSEFPVNLGTMFSYNDGLLGTPDAVAHFNPTLNGYKYYCDDLTENDPLTMVTQENRGVFRAGQKNVRHYKIELGAGLIFNYAIDASWQFPTGTAPWTVPDDFPPGANRSEAWNISVSELNNTLWNDGESSGGELSLLVDVYDWNNPELNNVRVESPGNFPMTESSTPVGGGEGYSTYRIDITDATPGGSAIDLLISIESDETGYGGLLPGKPVTSYFTHMVKVSGEEPGITGWARTWGAGNQDRGYGVATDSKGNIYVGGNYYSNVDFDPGEGVDIQPSPGNRASFFSKFDKDGNYQWARTWGGGVSFGGGVTDIAVDKDDNILLSGWFYGTPDFDPGDGEDFHTCNGDGADCYVSKFDSDGNFLWARTWGGDDWLDDSALGIDSDSSGNVYVGGGFRGSCDFDPGPEEDIHDAWDGYRDCFLVKYTPGGDYEWGVNFGGHLDDHGFGVSVDKKDDIYFTGRFYGDCDFDPGIGEDWKNYQSDGNMFLTKFDSDGNYIRAKTFGSGDAFRIAFDSYNNAYVSGGFGGTSQFDTDGGMGERVAHGSRDAFLNVYDEDGSWLWVITWDSIAPEDTTSGYIGYHVDIDDNDNIYYTAHFTGTADLDPDPIGVDEHVAVNYRDVFVSKFDHLGNHIWSRTFGGETTDDGAGVAYDEVNDKLYVTGWFGETVNFSPGPEEDNHISNGSLDVFLIQYKPDGTW